MAVKNRRGALLALIAMSVLWGYAWTGLKIGLIDAEPFTFTAVRMSMGALTLLIILGISGRPFWPTRVRELVTLGLVQTALLMSLSTWAIELGSAGRVAFLVYTMPFFTLLMAWPLLGERVRGLQWLAIAFAAAGLTAIIQPWHLHGSMGSNILAIATGMAWGLGAIMVKRLQIREPMDLVSMTAWQMVFGCIPLICFAGLASEAPINWTTQFIAVLFLVGVLTTGVGWLLWVYALDNLEAGTASLSTLAAPVIAMATSAYHLGERPSLLEIFGMVLIGTALFVLSMNAMRLNHLTAKLNHAKR